jgi:hypothetical protein
MKRSLKLALITGTLALCASPAMSLAAPGGNHPGAGASLPAKAKAYGKYCQNESKKHVDGTPGTPFSACVTAMAKLANGAVNNPRTACKELSKKHVDGEKGTPFSQCVSAGAKLLHDQGGQP